MTITILSNKVDGYVHWREFTATSFLSIRFNQVRVPLLSLYNFDRTLKVDYFVLNVGFEAMYIEICSIIRGLMNVLQGRFSLGDMPINSLMDIIDQWFIESSTHGKFVIVQLTIDKVSFLPKVLSYHGGA